jgi:pectinesterase
MGTGDYYNIQDAIDAMRVFYPLAPITLYIKNGIYNEKKNCPLIKPSVTFIGENVDSTIITYNDYSGKGKHTTFTILYCKKFLGNRFGPENINICK